ncbi:MAG: prolyl oligopeptidase family serine peptidase [Acidobacteria bacterium]|nr:prolyl oligopeptidase family serine peptidase [Acidobacteriota bacterium]
MAERKVAPYGSWKSPITSDLIVQGSVGLNSPTLDGATVYWVEVRPRDDGRSVVVRADADARRDLIHAPFNARTRVHEYGGGDYLVHRDVLYFSNFADQRLYRLARGDDAPRPLTPESASRLRFADMTPDAPRRRLIAVREDHTESDQEAANTLVALSLDGEADESGGEVLAAGYDFYSSPRVSPGGKLLAWLAWRHPNMPWDGTELWVGEFDAAGGLARARRVAGGGDESIFQPEWSPAGVLHFVSDRSGWWNLYRARLGETNGGGGAAGEGDGQAGGAPSLADEARGIEIESLCPSEAEFGEPQWGMGMATYAFLAPESVVCTFRERGVSRLGVLDATAKNLRRVETPFEDIAYVRASTETARAVFRAGSPVRGSAIVEFDPATDEIKVLRRSNDLTVDEGYLSAARAVEFPTEGGLTAHAFYYAPRNKDFAAPGGERPPLLVKSHGGPTAAAVTTLNLNIQYWTSRGFAVLDVNYGGSTGYGRAYRERLNGAWGITDVDDCVNAARYLCEQGLADAERCVIDGGSAGGYTTLAALTFRRQFKAGASYYGVSDLAALVRDTHKFESRYLDRLVAPYPAGEAVYRERSPIFFTERLACPVIFFQGLEDKVVPPNQAEMMVEALRRKGLPVAYVAFPGEQHGFRRAENIKRTLDGELYFYSRVFGFRLADEVEPVPIENL